MKGIAYASADISGAIQGTKLKHSTRDDNRRRHIGAIALYDWCWGNDQQWLYSAVEDQKLYSHDHGWFLPGAEATWDTMDMIQSVNDERRLLWHPQSMDQNWLLYYANQLRVVSATELLGILAKIPVDWPVTDEQLATVSWFLEQRAPTVATRLQHRASTGQTQ